MRSKTRVFLESDDCHVGQRRCGRGCHGGKGKSRTSHPSKRAHAESGSGSTKDRSRRDRHSDAAVWSTHVSWTGDRPRAYLALPHYYSPPLPHQYARRSPCGPAVPPRWPSRGCPSAAVVPTQTLCHRLNGGRAGVASVGIESNRDGERRRWTCATRAPARCTTGATRRQTWSCLLLQHWCLVVDG